MTRIKKILIIFLSGIVFFLVAIVARATPHLIRSYDSATRFADSWIPFEKDGRPVLGNGHGKIIKFGEYRVYDHTQLAVNTMGDAVALRRTFTPKPNGDLFTNAQGLLESSKLYLQELVIKNIFTGSERSLTKLDLTVINVRLKWSPDFQKIAFIEYRADHGLLESRDAVLVIIKTADGQPIWRQKIGTDIYQKEKELGFGISWLNNDELVMLETEKKSSDILWKINLNQQPIMTRLCQGHISVKKIKTGISNSLDENIAERSSSPTSDCMLPYLNDIGQLFGSLEYPIGEELSSTNPNNRYLFYSRERDCPWPTMFVCSRKVIEAYDLQTGRIHEVLETHRYYDSI